MSAVVNADRIWMTASRPFITQPFIIHRRLDGLCRNRSIELKTRNKTFAPEVCLSKPGAHGPKASVG
jgi:hypothetical protein